MRRDQWTFFLCTNFQAMFDFNLLSDMQVRWFRSYILNLSFELREHFSYTAINFRMNGANEGFHFYCWTCKLLFDCPILFPRDEYANCPECGYRLSIRRGFIEIIKSRFDLKDEMFSYQIPFIKERSRK